MIFKKIQRIIASINLSTIPEERKDYLQVLIDYIETKRKNNQKIKLNFICTHNSRRSQFSQVWAKVMAEFTGIKIECFSGGIEVTACNERTIASLIRFGFLINSQEKINPIYEIEFATEMLYVFSKIKTSLN